MQAVEIHFGKQKLMVFLSIKKLVAYPKGSFILYLTYNLPKNEHFLPTDTLTYVCISGVKK